MIVEIMRHPRSALAAPNQFCLLMTVVRMMVVLRRIRVLRDFDVVMGMTVVGVGMAIGRNDRDVGGVQLRRVGGGHGEGE